jgi:uncharacterized membrane protein
MDGVLALIDLAEEHPIATVLILLGVVILLAEMGGHGTETTRKILFVIGGFLLMAMIFGLVLARTIV